MATNKELINSEDFDKALVEGAEFKKNSTTTYKIQNKGNYLRFFELMAEANEDIKRIIETKKKNRTADDNAKLLKFKSDIRSMYNQAQLLTISEKLEEGKKTRVEKIVDRIVPVISILRYIDSDVLDKAFAKEGITVIADKLESKYSALATDDKKQILKEIFNVATNLKQQNINDNEFIDTTIYQTKVPVDLQFDKKVNNAGLKTSDFKKLVDMKAKMLAANSDEAKEKAEEKIEHIASEKQFEISRAELVRDKLTKL